MPNCLCCIWTSCPVRLKTATVQIPWISSPIPPQPCPRLCPNPLLFALLLWILLNSVHFHKDQPRWFSSLSWHIQLLVRFHSYPSGLWSIHLAVIMLPHLRCFVHECRCLVFLALRAATHVIFLWLSQGIYSDIMNLVCSANNQVIGLKERFLNSEQGFFFFLANLVLGSKLGGYLLIFIITPWAGCLYFLSLWGEIEG